MRNNNAFTLIELSVVIVIIGLIVAGIVAGQGLVKQAKIKQIISELQNYKTTINTFELKYDAVPGDMSNAQDYWGTPNVDNGNNNGAIDGGEELSAWYHLKIAGLIDDNIKRYTGGSDDNRVGEFTPLAPTLNSLSNGFKIGYQFAELSNGEFLFQGSRSPKVSILLSSVNSTATGQSVGPGITPSGAHTIDVKIDDGVAFRGKVMAGGAGGDSDAHLDNCAGRWYEPPSADYQLSVTGVHCLLEYNIK